jgi:hypothetical protein
MEANVQVYSPESKPMALGEVMSQVAEAANMMVRVKDADSFLIASNNRKRLLAIRKAIDGILDPNTKRWHEGWKAAIATKKSITDPLDSIVSRLAEEIVRWEDEQEAKRLKEEQEARAKAMKEEEDLRLAEAESLQKAGHAEAAEEVLSSPIEPPPVIVPKIVPKVANQGTLETWGGFEVIDQNIVPRDYLCVDEQKVRGYIKAMKSSAKIPGIRVLPPVRTLVQRTK